MSKEDGDKLESIDKTLREILKWTRFANISKLKETLETELDSDEKKLAYENTNDLSGLKEVAAIAITLTSTIAGTSTVIGSIKYAISTYIQLL